MKDRDDITYRYYTAPTSAPYQKSGRRAHALQQFLPKRDEEAGHQTLLYEVVSFTFRSFIQILV